MRHCNIGHGSSRKSALTTGRLTLPRHRLTGGLGCSEAVTSRSGPLEKASDRRQPCPRREGLRPARNGLSTRATGKVIRTTSEYGAALGATTRSYEIRSSTRKGAAPSQRNARDVQMLSGEGDTLPPAPFTQHTIKRLPSGIGEPLRTQAHWQDFAMRTR